MRQHEFDHLLRVVKGLSLTQARRLREQLENQISQATKPPAASSVNGAKRTKAAQRQKKSLSIEGLHRQMIARGLITQLPDPALDIDDDNPDDRPVPIKGEPLSQTIIRERR
jgi:hypothetical protein